MVPKKKDRYLKFNLVLPERSAIDQKFFNLFSPLVNALPEYHTLLYPSSEQLRVAKRTFFRSSYRENPDLRPTQVDARAIENHSVQLNKLKTKILSHDSSLLGQVYADRIDELIANDHLVLAAAINNSEGFAAANEFIYGTPDYTIFAAVCDLIRSEALESKERISSAEDVLLAVPDLRGDKNLLIPSETDFQKVRATHFIAGAYVDQLFDGTAIDEIPENVIFTRDIGDPILLQILANIGSNYRIGDSPDPFWGIMHSWRKIVRPANYLTPAGEPLLKKQFIGVVLHEMSHLIEFINGSKQPLRLLSKGLARYESSNEGRAVLRELLVYESFAQAARSSSWQNAVLRYFTIACALGLDREGQTRNFSETFALVFAVERFWQQTRLQNRISRAHDFAREGAWKGVARIMLGTDGNGGAYRKDLTYLRGLKNWLRATKKKPECIINGDVGKFALTNKGQIQLLKQQGSLPEDFPGVT